MKFKIATCIFLALILFSSLDVILADSDEITDDGDDSSSVNTGQTQTHGGRRAQFDIECKKQVIDR